MGLLNVGVSLTSSLALFARIFEYLDLPVEVDDPAPPGRGRPGHGRRARPVRGASPSPTPAADAPPWPASTSTSRPAPRWPWSARPARARARSPSLIARLYDPTGGRITIDGVDLRDLRLADLAAIVGVVSQETYLLHTTVRENLRYAKPDATDAEIEAAARAAQIHDLIAGLPEGYDTMVGSRGHRFSGGEKQRIAIARTLLRNPRVLVLDEATSALDTETERAVQQAFDELAHGRTTITIAHRLSTVRDADQIVVIDHGRVVETGHARPPARAATAGTPRSPPDGQSGTACGDENTPCGS